MGLFSCMNCNSIRKEAKKIAPRIYGSDFCQFRGEASRQRTLCVLTETYGNRIIKERVPYKNRREMQKMRAEGMILC